jgi:uncharacterized membrane protein
MPIRCRCVLVLLLAACLVRVGVAEAAPALVVTGRVVHGETGSPVPGVEVRVLGMSPAPPLQAVTRSDAAGWFRVPVDPSYRVYVVQATYRGVVYTAGPLRPDGRELDVTVRVYETTEDPRGLVVVRRAILLEQAAPGVLDVREVIVLGNTLQRTYVGVRGETLHLPLLLGARDVSVQQGMAPVGLDAEGALVDSLPVTPGLREIVLTYRLPHRAERIRLALPVNLPVEALDVFVPAPMRVTSTALSHREVRTVQGQSIARVWGTNLPAGRSVDLELSGLLPPPLELLPRLGAALLVLGVVAAAALPWLRRSGAPLGAVVLAAPPPVEEMLDCLRWMSRMWGVMGGMMPLVWWWAAAVLLFWALLIAGLVILIVVLLRPRPHRQGGQALEVLRTRLARGEITPEEYERLRRLVEE